MKEDTTNQDRILELLILQLENTTLIVYKRLLFQRKNNAKKSIIYSTAQPLIMEKIFSDLIH